MRSKKELMAELSEAITIESIGDIFTNPKIALPILWGVVITLSLYSMVMTTWVYSDWVDKENRIGEIGWDLYEHEVRLISLEIEVFDMDSLGFNYTITEMDYDTQGRPIDER